jgi:hypothetical protein
MRAWVTPEVMGIIYFLAKLWPTQEMAYIRLKVTGMYFINVTI